MRRSVIEVASGGGNAGSFTVDADVAETFFERARGLIGRERPSSGRGMLIPRCNAVHTFFMRYDIDVFFLDSKGRLVKAVRGVKPWRAFVWGGWRSTQALETPSDEEGRTTDLNDKR